MIRIEERYQSFRVVTDDHRVLRAYKYFLKQYTEKDIVYDFRSKHTITTIKYVFKAGNELENEFFIHHNAMNTFIQYLKEADIGFNEIELINVKTDRSQVTLNYKDVHPPKGYQDKYEKAITKDDGLPAKLVDLQTGKGKTFIAAKAITTIGMRTILLLLPMYVKKWIVDLKFYFNLEEDEIVTINGRDALVNFLENDDGRAKFILLSNRTFLNFINEYETSPSASTFYSPMLPKDICEKLNIGVVLVDEVHREVYSVYKAMLYLDPILFLGLSATFRGRGFIKRIQDLMFDDKSRLSLLEFDAYAEVYSIAYNFDQPKRIEKGSSRMRGYNHIEFEKIILKNKYLKHNYFKMIKTYIDQFYIKDYRPTDKAIIFCSSTIMCTELTTYLKTCYQKLSITRYVAEDPQENLYDSDIRVSTIKSAGEAVDIPGLTYGALTVAIGSDVPNEQALGRLREIKGRSVVYNYFYSINLRPHKKYHYAKLKLFNNRVKFVQGLTYDRTLKSTCKN